MIAFLQDIAYDKILKSCEPQYLLKNFALTMNNKLL